MSSVTIDESISEVYLLNEFPLHPIRTKNANCITSDASCLRGQPHLKKPIQQNTEKVIKLYKAVNTDATATSALKHESTLSKTVRVIIFKISWGCSRENVEELIINVTELDE